jgi:hypothetical protein
VEELRQQLAAAKLAAAAGEAKAQFRESLTKTYPGLVYEVLHVRRLHPPEDLLDRNR